LKGTIVSIDKSAKLVTVDHEAIPGLMGAMTMPYGVKDERLLDTLAPGDEVTAQVVTGSPYWLDDVHVTKRGAAR
jgi:protein SCO1/2